MYQPMHTWWGWISAVVTFVVAVVASTALLDFSFTEEWVWVLPIVVASSLVVHIIFVLVLWFYEQPQQRKQKGEQARAKMSLVADYWLIITTGVMLVFMFIVWLVFVISTNGELVPLVETPVTKEDFDTWQHHLIAKALALMTTAHFVVNLAIFLSPSYGLIYQMMMASRKPSEMKLTNQQNYSHV